jgi:CubicO group peptidase (beta-lactamase class C family)
MKEKFLYLFFILLLLGCSTETDENEEVKQFDWEISNPIELGIDENRILDAFSKAGELDYLYSVLVIRDGKIAAERYFNGYHKDSYYKIKSVSKSFLSAALGIAIKQGVISLDDKLTDILPEYNFLIIDDRFHSITLAQLMKMRSGLDKDTNIYSTVVNSPNWLNTIFSMGLAYDPGEKFVYSTPGTHLLSAVLTKESGRSSLLYVKENLLDPIGMEINDWDQDPQGIYFGGNNMYFTTRNMAVLGLLYLNDGILNNIQIVPKNWVYESLRDNTGGIGNWGVLKNIGYGYLWWLGEIDGYKIFTAIGHGGQFVLCVPELNLIVATNAHSNIWWEEANAQELEILNLIGNYIIPSVLQ